MTNSLSLKQCHFVGQSSILFPKYIYESFQGLYNPDRIRFLSLIRGSYSYGGGHDGAPPREPDSGCAVSHRLEAQARSSSLMIRMADIKTYPFVFIRSYVFYLKMLQNKNLENKRLLCSKKWHCLSNASLPFFGAFFVSFSSLSTSRSLNLPERADRRRNLFNLSRFMKNLQPSEGICNLYYDYDIIVLFYIQVYILMCMEPSIYDHFIHILFRHSHRRDLIIRNLIFSIIGRLGNRIFTVS